MQQRTVRVVADPVEVNTLNMEGETVPLGLIHIEEYQGEDHIRYSFQGEGQDAVKPIGTSKNQLPIVDPARALTPLLENGWKIQRQYGLDGGDKFHVILTPNDPDARRIADPIQWDYGMWGKTTTDRDEEGTKFLQESLIVDGSLSPRNAFKFNRGLHRLICDNGMTHKLLEFGRVRVTHSAFDPNVLITNLGGFDSLVGRDDERILGPVFGSAESAHRFSTFIRRNFLSPDDADGPGLMTIPNILRDSSKTLSDLPKWYLGEYATQMQMMADNLDRPVRTLDVLNAITNPISIEENRIEEERRATLRILNRQDGLLEATEQMIGVFDLVNYLN